MAAVLPGIEKDQLCFHCGQVCHEVHWSGDKTFCCSGCQTVYEILDENNLCAYYELNEAPGVRSEEDITNFGYLNNQTIRKKLLIFDSSNFAKVEFIIPAIHCVSCIWLLENLRTLNDGILHSEVNFARKSALIDFNPSVIDLSGVAALLSQIGYPPLINLGSGDPSRTLSRSLLLKLAVAGFCFGNVMLLSFPQYLGIGASDISLVRLFSFLNASLAVPVLLYSGNDYLRSALKSFQLRQINMDVPIALGLLTLFSRSAYDVFTGNGPGYFDSFTGLVFFLLIGRWFQSKTYDSLAFDRDFRSYFPLAVNKLVDGNWTPVIIHELKKGDEINVRNREIVPADSVLLDNPAYIDYSFVTGESRPVHVLQNDLVYAGGRLIGKPVSLRVEEKPEQSHLTSLWNDDAFRKERKDASPQLSDRIARSFTWIVLGVALGSGLYWYFFDPRQVWLTVTAVLIVACPCALALTGPFTYGNILRLFGRNAFYLKHADVIERLAAVDTIVFDKTGTVTYSKNPIVRFVGIVSDEVMGWIKILTGYSTHPFSRLISTSIGKGSQVVINGFNEIPGKGIEGNIGGHTLQIGSGEFAGLGQKSDQGSSRIFVSLDGEPVGHFEITVSVRESMREMIRRLGKKCVAMLSGDNDSDRVAMRDLFGPQVELQFNQQPQDKLVYIQHLQRTGRNVMFLGDGLNDAGALKQSDVGIAVTDNTGIFTPACDGILKGDRLGQLDRFVALARSSRFILISGFTLSFAYNAIALGFAVTGNLTPFLAAILMPLSSISVVVFTTLSVGLIAKKILDP
jgi:P-type Cu+ transporter